MRPACSPGFRDLLQRLWRLDRERLARADLGRADGAGRQFRDVFVPGIRDMANTTVDVWSVLAGIWTGTIRSASLPPYDRVLFKGTRLAQLPAAPLFV